MVMEYNTSVMVTSIVVQCKVIRDQVKESIYFIMVISIWEHSKTMHSKVKESIYILMKSCIKVHLRTTSKMDMVFLNLGIGCISMKGSSNKIYSMEKVKYWVTNQN